MRTISIIAIIMIMLGVGCKTRTVGNNSNNNNENLNTNTNQNNNQPDLLTYRIFTNEFVEDILEYELDPTRPCMLQFSDLHDNYDDNRLCQNMQILGDIHADQDGYADGSLRPDYADPRAEYWHNSHEAFGFFNNQYGVRAQDVGVYDWYGGANGSLTYKGLLTYDENALAYPGYQMTMEEWDAWKIVMQNWLDQSAFRIGILEVFLTKFYGGPTISLDECVSAFTDIDDNTIECVITHTGLDYDLIDVGPPALFEPYWTLTWPQLISMGFKSRNIPSTTEECWAPCNGRDEWVCPWMNTACQYNLIPEGVNTFDDLLGDLKRLPAYRWINKLLQRDL